MKENLCAGCMRDRGTAEVCPHCGYAENSLRIQTYLAPRSVLDNRYLVGRVLSYNGEGVTYIGYDTVVDRRIEIREYFPDMLVVRAEDGCSVTVKPGCQIPFKANMSDFVELMQKLSHIRTLSCLQQVWGIVEQNGTVYAIQECMDGTTLQEYLDRRGVMFTWNEASDLLLPVIKTLNLIHQEGIIHRGVSPSTIWVSKGHIKLGGFCISAVRAARTELAAELFPGYSAPEQYSAVSPHGTWTDVYAVSALLYTCMTGQCPPEALIRSSRELPPPRECNETVSPRVSLAILQGLSLSPDDRIRTLGDLIGRIGVSAQSGGESPTIAIPAARSVSSPSAPKQPSHTASAHTQTIPVSRTTTVKASSAASKPVKKKGNTVQGTSDRRLLINSMLITLPILLLILIFTFWYLFGDKAGKDTSSETASLPSSSVSDHSSSIPSSRPSQPVISTPSSSEPSSEEFSESEEMMVSLVGMQYEDVLNNADYMALFTLEEPELIYSETDAEGMVVWQSVAANSVIEPGISVRVKVSRGSQYIDIPDYEKRTMEDYTAELDDLGIHYIIAYKDNSGYPAGYVVGYDSPNGDKYDIEKMPVIQIYVSNEE